jgi:O-antigen/teichoic acid export membrane protein
VGKYLVEFQYCWEILIGMALATILIALLYIFALRYIAKPILYISMVSILIALLLMGIWCYMKSDEYRNLEQDKNY